MAGTASIGPCAAGGSRPVYHAFKNSLQKPPGGRNGNGGPALTRGRTGILRFERKMKWLLRTVLALVVCYVGLFSTVIVAMLQPPERFGAFMRHMPPAVVWGGLPASRMWLWARKGTLAEGDMAPDFTLRTAQDRARRVALGSYRGQRPVVLVFGSYT
jgi:hypothetical protein